MKLYPQCWCVTMEGDYKPNDGFPGAGNGLAFTASGHLLPCCYLYKYHNYKNNTKNLWDDELRVDRNDDLLDIIESEQWYNFHKELYEHPENACKECHTHCSKPK